MFYLTTHSTHFIYGYMASEIWQRTTHIARGNWLPPHSIRLASRVLLYLPSHRQDNTYHGLCYTNSEALPGMSFANSVLNLLASLLVIVINFILFNTTLQGEQTTVEVRTL